MGNTESGTLMGTLGFAANTLLQVSATVAETTRTPRWRVAIDIMRCAQRWGATPNDYLFFRFFELSERERGTYVVHRISRRLVARYNDVQSVKYFQDKTLFAERFADLYGRNWAAVSRLDLSALTEFVASKETIIYKPSNLMKAMGVEKLNIVDYPSLAALLKYLKEHHGGRGIIEDWIIQHSSISAIYSRAVNPVRVITILKDNDCHILNATLTIGNGRDVANASCGDMVAPIELDSGIIAFPAQDETGRIYHEHPATGHEIEGFRIPYWAEIIKLVDQASRVTPEVGYVGWDIAVTPRGPILIEGNHNPGYRFQQLPAHLPARIGNAARYRSFL